MCCFAVVQLLLPVFVTLNIQRVNCLAHQCSRCRHENIILFMGACTIPPHLAIVMEWCAGATLYHELHVKEQADGHGLTLHESVDIALQTARGMGYVSMFPQVGSCHVLYVSC